MQKIVYIMSDNRSGSTLLDQLLGAHQSVMSLGEVHHLPAYALQNRSLYNPTHLLNCYCGMTVAECSFWRQVERRLGRTFGSLVLRPRLRGTSATGGGLSRRAAYFARRIIESNPKFIRRPLIANLLNGPRVATDSFALFEAIFDETKADCLIDSSKDPLRFRLLYDHEPDRMFVIMLGRDYRGTIHSKMKRGRDLASSARSWVRRIRQMKELSDDIPAHQQLRVRYEDLCGDPRTELTRICRFLHLDFSDAMLNRPFENAHHLGGSPSKFDSSRKAIELDKSYLDAFTPRQLETMKEIVGETATDWGYK